MLKKKKITFIDTYFLNLITIAENYFIFILFYNNFLFILSRHRIGYVDVCDMNYVTLIR